MEPVESSLLKVLSEHPDDWDLRLLIADHMEKRGAIREAVTLFSVATTPPPTEEALHRVVDLAETEALDLAILFVRSHPANAYGHQTLGTIYQWLGKEDKAQEHREAAAALDSLNGNG